ncbi:MULTISPECIES: cytochrome c [Rhodomicrobium]|uniref:c-type cytochrome n=1 Tax=Rhodomicrobium TaxID=1068 RepID=UPI000B4AC8B5|nr:MULTISPECIES: cytochrome c [Rhodomicrobium]
MKRSALIAIGLVAVLAVLGAGAAYYAWEPEIPPVDPGKRPAFDPALIRRGAVLAALGDCNTCHTAPGGKPFAGGLPIPTPFGTIYSTNITPDAETGIGRWPEAAFARAMRRGVDRERRHQYPAFPYDHFTKVTDEDNRALYAFLMTRQPVGAETPPNALPFPINFRPIVAGWKLLFLREGPYKPDPSRDAVWNRGAYLVEGIGHCGACHTPRNMLGAEKQGQMFSGGDAEGWHAFAINHQSPSPILWDATALAAYLRQGWHGMHGVARGPMAPVTANLANAPDEDVTAIAAYVASVMGEASPERREQSDRLISAAKPSGIGDKPQSAGSQTVPPTASGDLGKAIYASTCASCHESGRPVPYGGISLSLSSVVNSDDPRNLINVVLAGLPAAEGVKTAIMPGFAAVLTDPQAVALLAYLRAEFSDRPAWTGLEAQLREARQSHVALKTTSGPGRPTSETISEDKP